MPDELTHQSASNAGAPGVVGQTIFVRGEGPGIEIRDVSVYTLPPLRVRCRRRLWPLVRRALAHIDSPTRTVGIRVGGPFDA